MNPNTSSILSPGEIAVGQMVTVLAWQPIVHEPDGFSALITGITTTSTITDHSYEGDVLEVLAVQIPFVVVKNQTDTFSKCSIKLDTRRVTLMELKPEYVKARLGQNQA